MVKLYCDCCNEECTDDAQILTIQTIDRSHEGPTNTVNSVLTSPVSVCLCLNCYFKGRLPDIASIVSSGQLVFPKQGAAQQARRAVEELKREIATQNISAESLKSVVGSLHEGLNIIDGLLKLAKETTEEE